MEQAKNAFFPGYVLYVFTRCVGPIVVPRLSNVLKPYRSGCFQATSYADMYRTCNSSYVLPIEAMRWTMNN